MSQAFGGVSATSNTSANQAIALDLLKLTVDLAAQSGQIDTQSAALIKGLADMLQKAAKEAEPPAATDTPPLQSKPNVGKAGSAPGTSDSMIQMLAQLMLLVMQLMEAIQDEENGSGTNATPKAASHAGNLPPAPGSPLGQGPKNNNPGSSTAPPAQQQAGTPAPSMAPAPTPGTAAPAPGTPGTPAPGTPGTPGTPAPGTPGAPVPQPGTPAAPKPIPTPDFPGLSAPVPPKPNTTPDFPGLSAPVPATGDRPAPAAPPVQHG